MAAGGAGTDLSWPSTRHGPFGTSSCGPWCHGLERLSNGFVGTSGGRRSRARRRFAHGVRRWAPDGAKRLVGQRVGQPGKADEKGQAVADPTRDDERHRPAEAVGGH
ncbi:DUF6192 family protein [Streptomyces canus]|uniref:DUF6192 family protein n=1 Tax=Streptomyces canus TaxID=58343 RepID=UPI0038650237